MKGTSLTSVAAGAVVVALVAVSIPQVAQAQERQIKVGGKGAFNLSRVRGDATGDEGETIDFGTGNGFSLGGLLAVDVHPNVTLQPEFMYSSKEVDAEISLDGERASGEIETGFFEIPVLLKLHGARPSRARPFALVGATFSFLTAAEQTISFMGIEETQDVKDELTGSDVGLTIGGGVDLMQAWGLISLDARYTFGLRSLDDVDSVKQDTFAVSAALIF